jgi:peptide/nickel transport system permease protein
MLAFAARRLLGMLLVLAAVSVLVFLIFVVVPGGDPAQRMAGRNATEQNVENIRHDWGFDQPIYVQYGRLMKQLFTGTLISYTTRTSVLDEIRRGMPATFSLAIGASIIWLGFGVLAGTISGIAAGRVSDRVITILALIGVSMPVFWLGVVARYYLAEKNTWFPDGGYVPLSENPIEWFWHLVLPWLVLSSVSIGLYARVLRSNVIDSNAEDYVRTARAKGLPRRQVISRHVLRNSLIPIVTLFGLDFAAVLGGGAILTETVFELHGVGQYAQQSIDNLDLPPLIGVTMYAAAFIVVFSSIVDLLYARLDPRIRVA